MRRKVIGAREHWKEEVEKVGMTYHTLPDGSPYWDESVYWEFTSGEIDRLEAATAELQKLALAAGDAILERGWLGWMGIPEAAHARIRETWETEPPALYGRMDLAYDGLDIKLLEYNADTPTSLIEAAVVQWYWLEGRFPDADQWNSLHEKLVAKWKDLKGYLASPVVFANDGADEDQMTTIYLADTAMQAGLKTRVVGMGEIGWSDAKEKFVTPDGHWIGSLFKLYPWEWVLKDEFGQYALTSMETGQHAETSIFHEGKRTQWLEPIWKMMWSSKALLAVMWEMNRGHELLLPAYLDGPREMKDYVRKPLVGREGGGVQVFVNGEQVEAEEGQYKNDGGAGVVYQGLAKLAEADGKTAVLGSWLVDGEPAGLGIRESNGRITNNRSRFVPHLFR